MHGGGGTQTGLFLKNCTQWRAKFRPDKQYQKNWYCIDKRIFMHRTLMITHHQEEGDIASPGHNWPNAIQSCTQWASTMCHSVVDGWLASISPASA